MISRGKPILAAGAHLAIRNSQFYEVVFHYPKAQSLPASIQIPASANIQFLRSKLAEFNLTNVQFTCIDELAIAAVTPLESLLNRQFYISSQQYDDVEVVGQLQEVKEQDEEINGLINLELARVKRKDIEDYVGRVEQWIKLRYEGQGSEKVKLNREQTSEILVEALIDPLPQERRIHLIEAEWHRLYMISLQLRQQKQKAERQCQKKVSWRMRMGLGAILANIGFVWSGTYIFYSWDIIQPIAYFIDSAAAIMLTYQFFKIRKQYSPYNYKMYLYEKFLPQVYLDSKFNLKQFQENQIRLKQVQSVLKDHYAKNI